MIKSAASYPDDRPVHTAPHKVGVVTDVGFSRKEDPIVQRCFQRIMRWLSRVGAGPGSQNSAEPPQSLKTYSPEKLAAAAPL